MFPVSEIHIQRPNLEARSPQTCATRARHSHTSYSLKCSVRWPLFGKHCWENIQYTEPTLGTLLQNQQLFWTHLAKVEIHQPDHPVLGRTWRAPRRGDYKFVMENRGDSCNSIPLQFSFPFNSNLALSSPSCSSVIGPYLWPTKLSVKCNSLPEFLSALSRNMYYVLYRFI